MPDDWAEIRRQVRVACAPDAGADGASRKACVDCGAEFWDWTEKWRRYCASCGAERMRARWRRGQAPRSSRRT